MRRIFVFVTLVGVALAMGMGVGPVVAQDAANNSSDELEDDDAAIESSDDYSREIDSETRIADWSYNPGMFEITIEADDSTTVSITEGGDYDEGTGSFNYREFDVEEGTNTITMPVTDRQGAGVAIATRRSLAQGGGATVSTGQVEQNPFRHFGGESGLFSGIIMTVSLAGIGAWYVVRSEASGVVDA
ncbi:hypothetical protein GS429_04300 [Natronorubrum sp. JWXQ-INN-674]|uniref:Uncharacterized protein n=1 Tax=Natronorubrum halalkaliphilum TaxID=2691917 RepID=A0A6B0VJJ4_9EURY|nr:hypothetical protein [Natronorubrum halalkaliphilum]MXV61297.1 hypothetical protein [Natronorubrum halalkaliphilum]